MKKQVIVFGIIILFISVGLSGCNEQTNEISNPMIINNFQVTPNIIQVGGTANLTWDVVGAIVVNIDNGIGTVSLNGTRIIQPEQTTTYTLTASNATHIINATTKIIVENNENTSGNRIAVMDTTMGVIRVELFEDKMPITTANFINLQMMVFIVV